MNAHIDPSCLAGTVAAIPSKSFAHRLLICAAFANQPTEILCEATSADIEATLSCLTSLGIHIKRGAHGFLVVPSRCRSQAVLDCVESGSTLRFMLPVVGALGCGALFEGRGRLASRPLTPLVDEMIAAGCDIVGEGRFPLEVAGRMRPGRFELAGDVSSQYITGLLLAAPLTGGDVCVSVREPIQSRPYVNITIEAMKHFGVEVHTIREHVDPASTVRNTNFCVLTGEHYRSPGVLRVEGDWSNAAFWLAAAALGKQPICVEGLNQQSSQGDRAILAALALFGARVERNRDMTTVFPAKLHAAELNVSDIPDLVCPLAAVAAFAQGTTRFTHAERLRLKESNRLDSISRCVNALGGHAEATADELIVEGCESVQGGYVDAARDHRICMLAAILATRANASVTIRGAECVSKSYPGFFEDYTRLGGRVKLRS